MNDYCQQVMEGDVVDFNNCAADEDQDEEGKLLLLSGLLIKQQDAL